MTSLAQFMARTPLWMALRWLVLVGIVAVVIIIGASFTARPVDQADSALRSSANTSSVAFTAPLPTVTVGSDCWVSGDLVGNGNPVVVAAVLCGR